MKKYFFLFIIPFISFSQNDFKRKLELNSTINTGLSYFGNSPKTNMDFGIKIMFTDDDDIMEDVNKIGIGFVSSFIFDSQSQNQFRAHGDVNFLDFILYFEDNNTESSITFGFLNRDDNNIFYDKAFRLIFTQQLFESLNVHGGFYLDRDKKPDKNTRHDLPIFGFSFQF